MPPDARELELQQLTLKMLKVRAHELGAQPSSIDELDDATEPKVAAVALVVLLERAQAAAADASEEAVRASPSLDATDGDPHKRQRTG